MKLTATWLGTLPAIGDYLKSARGRFAYRICGVAVSASGTIDHGEVLYETFRTSFFVERVPVKDLPTHARVHPWKWANRSPKEK